MNRDKNAQQFLISFFIVKNGSIFFFIYCDNGSGDKGYIYIYIEDWKKEIEN